jgi:hypothetical protein
MRDAIDYDIFYARHEQQDATSLLLSDLLSLMRRVETSIRFNDLALAVVSLENDDPDGNFFVLDDLIPRYAMANAALTASHIMLGNAFSRLQVASKLDGPTSISRLSPRIVQCALVEARRNA